MPQRLAAAFVLLLLAGLATAEDWPGWRGPRADGTVLDTGYPLTWSDKQNVKWKTPLPGGGHSSPIVSKGKVFVTGCVEAEQRRVLYCLDRTGGKILWDETLLKVPLEYKHGENSFASSTAATDGERVYVTFFEQHRARVFGRELKGKGFAHVYCYDTAGKKLWEKVPGEFYSVHGFCSPPTLYNDLVIVNCDQDAKAYLVAFDKRTGEERWRADRPNKTRSYCPPVVIEAAGRKQLVLTGSKSVASYDPDTGKQLWVIDGPTEQFVSSMVYHDGVLLMTAGFPEHWVMAIDPAGSGNVTKTHTLWSKQKEGGYVPSPVAYRGMLFLVDDDGAASCWDVRTGERYWKETLRKRRHHASAVVADGRVYFTDDDGITRVVKADKEFDILATNPLGEKVMASPAFSDREIFIRSEKHLWCIAGK